MVVCSRSHRKWMQPGIYQSHGCWLHLSGFAWGHQPAGGDVPLWAQWHVVFPKCLLLDKSQSKELQKWTPLSLSPILLLFTNELNIILKITHHMFYIKSFWEIWTINWHSVIQGLCNCKLIQFGGGCYLKEKNRKLSMKVNMYLG